jgi:hypothetical protein
VTLVGKCGHEFSSRRQAVRGLFVVCPSFCRNLREYYLKSVYDRFKGTIQETTIIITRRRRRRRGGERRRKIDSMRKTAILGASHVVQNVLESES